MNIYNEDGRLDYDLARNELLNTSQVRDRNTKRDALAALQAAALLDIGDSLRVLAVEAALSMGGALNAGPEQSDEEVSETLTLAILDAPEGSQVAWETDDGLVTGILTGESGLDQGEAWVGVEGAGRVWASSIVSCQTPHPADDYAGGDGVIEPLEAEREDAEREGYLAPAVADLAEDLDDDFDGDEHKAAEDALAALKAREAERKAAKKKGGKK